MASTPLCTIVIVNCNGGDWVVRCLDSIDRFTTAKEGKVIVVDNASTDGSLELLAARSPRLPTQLVHNRTNLGFGRACNQGVQTADTPYILLLNSDCELREPTIPPIVKLMDRQPHIGIVFCKLLNTDLTLQPSVNDSTPGPWSMLAELAGWSTARRAMMKSPLGKKLALGGTLQSHEAVHDVAWGGGNFMFMRRKDSLEIGGFDDAFFLYYEDIDLCLRMRQLGRILRYLPNPAVIHHWARSTAPSEINPLLEHYRSRLHYVEKHFSSRWTSILHRSARLELRLRHLLLQAASSLRKSPQDVLRLRRHRDALKALR